MPESKASVSVKEMVSWLDIELNAYEALLNDPAVHPAIFESITNRKRGVAAARNYILAAQCAIAERDAEIAETERMLREEWWLNHRCPISALYGDDGEMQCNAACCRKDFKRVPVGELSAHVCQRRLAAATTDMTLLEEARAEIAEMRTVTGPKCPKCGHWLKAEHCARDESGLVGSDAAATQFVCWIGDSEHEAICTCEITSVDLLANHPDIAAELGLTSKELSSAD